MGFDYQSYLTELSAEAPSGSDMEFDADFARMEKAAKGTPDQQFGSTYIEARPPDWAEVSAACLQLLEKTRDLRVATYLARAALVTDGLCGFRDGMQLLAGFVEKFWNSVYPQLDPDDDNDPTIRVNSLLELSNQGGLLRDLRNTPILQSPAVGRFSWTDVAVAKGELQPTPEMSEVPTLKKIDAAAESCNLDELKAWATAVEETLACAKRIDKGFSDQVGDGLGPNLQQLLKDLFNINKLQKSWIEKRSGSDDEFMPPSDAGAGREMIAVESGGAPVQVVRPLVSGGESFVILKREDAIEGLDKIIKWFERYEPSSPLPMLLKRAKRLSKKSFLDILKDISPGGIDQALLVGGREEEEEAPPPPAAPAAKKPDPKPAPRPPVDDSY